MLQMSQVYVHWWKTFVKCWLSTVAVLFFTTIISAMKETYILLRNQTEFPKMSNNSKNSGVEFAEHGSTWTQFLDHVLTIFHGMDLLLNVRSKWMPAKVRFCSLTLDQQISLVVSAFKQKLGMVNWSTLAATLGVCYYAVRPLCHRLRLITEMAPTSFCFLLWTLGSISWISLWTIACVTDSAIHQKIGSS